MKILTFYFSGIGNTKWVIHQLDILLKKQGHTITVVAIENLNIDEYANDTINSFDYIGFAYHIYGANIPRIMLNYINKFTHKMNNNSISTKLFFVNAFAYVNGHGIFETKKIINATSLKIIAYVNVKMPNSAPIKSNKKIISIGNFDEKIIRNAEKNY